jgi:hypothetical protein
MISLARPCLSIIQGSDQQPHPLLTDTKLNMEEYDVHQCTGLGTDLTVVVGWGGAAEAPQPLLEVFYGTQYE